MNTQELYQLLISDVPAFNEWRIQNPDVYLDFSGMDFGECELCDALLVNMNFRNARFERANLEYTCMCSSDFTGANCSHILGTGAHFGAIEVVEAHLPAHFTHYLKKGAILDKVDFSYAELAFANFRNTSLNATLFHASDLQHAHFASSSHKNAFFDDAATEHTFFS